jgi:hypothetical protein
VIKITNFTQISGYLGNMGALGPKMSILVAYLVPNFDSKIGLLNKVINKVLGKPYGCSKQFLQQQVLAT